MRTRVFGATLLMVLLVVVFATACGSDAQSNGHSETAVDDTESKSSDLRNGFDKMPPAGTGAFCPVMKNSFTVREDSEYSAYKGKYYVYCCPGCKPKFDADPEKYIKEL